VRVRKRKAGGRMVKRRVRPRSSVVALRALGRREARGDVIGNVAAERLRLVPIRSVAAVTIRRSQRVIVVHVALRAGCGGMHTR